MVTQAVLLPQISINRPDACYECVFYTRDYDKGNLCGGAPFDFGENMTERTPILAAKLDADCCMFVSHLPKIQ